MNAGALGPIDWAVVAGYFAGMLWLGSRFRRRQQSAERYFLGNRALPGWAVGASMFATIISSWAFLALPAKAFQSDLQYLMVISAVPSAAWIAARWIVPLFRERIRLMPPHYQLRFGRPSETAVGFIADVAGGADIDIVVHQYPAWTKVCYSLAEMLEMVNLPRVVCIKMGTRDMARWLYDYERLKSAAPRVTILTCHDEYLLPTLLEAGDGALIGFAGFAPELMVALVDACVAGDLITAKEAQKTVAPLARLIYGFGEPGCTAHQRMKTALWLMGKISSPVFRRPTRPLEPEQVDRIRQDFHAIGCATVR